MRSKPLPTVEYVRQCLRCDDGKLYWLVRPIEHFKTQRDCNAWNSRFSGKEAGSLQVHYRSGYQTWGFRINYVMFYRHVITWVLHYGEWPSQLDHKNRNSIDDHIENLRLSDQSQNVANGSMRSDNRSGVRGVSWDSKRGKWQVHVSFRRKHKSVGRFDNIDEAKAAYATAAREHHGEFSSDGKGAF